MQEYFRRVSERDPGVYTQKAEVLLRESVGLSAELRDTWTLGYEVTQISAQDNWTLAKSRRGPFQLMVICSQLSTEGLLLFEITLRKGQKLVQPFAVMVAAYRLVQPPPDQANSIPSIAITAIAL